METRSELVAAVRAGLRYFKLQAAPDDVAALRVVVEALTGYLPSDDSILQKARDRLAGGQIDYPGRRIRNMVFDLAEHVAEMNGLQVSRTADGEWIVEDRAK